MKNAFLFAILVTSIIGVMAFHSKTEKPKGAFRWVEGDREQVILLIDGYFTHTIFDKTTRKFIRTRGGSFKTPGDEKLEVFYEFDTENKDLVGTFLTYDFEMEKDELETNISGQEEDWERIDDGNNNLAGLWKITARQQDGKMVPIHQSGTRKTIKILSSTRFQWAAIDPGTKQFMGTGGGTYSFENGKYTENIEFFSRDSSRVGQSLTFDGKLENGEWHHSGFSSRGVAIYEVWSRKME